MGCLSCIRRVSDKDGVVCPNCGQPIRKMKKVKREKCDFCGKERTQTQKTEKEKTICEACTKSGRY